MAGVNAFSTQYACGNGAAANGGVVVAQWMNGNPLIVRGMVKGRNRVDLNMFPVSAKVGDNSFWTGDGTNIMRNALLYQ